MYRSSYPRPQRVAGWGQFRIGNDLLIIARDSRRIEIKTPPGAGIGPRVVSRVLEVCDGSRGIDQIVDDVLGAYPDASPGAIRSLVDGLAEKCILIDAAVPLPADVTPDDVASYRRHLAYYSEFETAAISRYDYLSRLHRSKVVLVGLGGAGSLMAASLASSGIRQIIGIDGDCVEETNLHRQLFYMPQDVDRKKADALAERLVQRVPELSFTPISEYMMEPNQLLRHLDGVDLVIHMCDYPPRQSRLTTNEACRRSGVPVLYYFNTSCGPLFAPGLTACFRCYEIAAGKAHQQFEEISSAVDDGGPYGSRTRPGVNLWMTGVATSEAIAFLSGARRPVTMDGMIVVDPVLGEARHIPLARQPECDQCAGVVGGQAAS